MRRQYSALLGSRLLGSLLQAVTFIAFARMSTPAEVGLIGVVIGVGMFLVVLFDLGLSQLLSRLRVRAGESEVRAALVLHLAMTLVFGVLFSLGVAVVFAAVSPGLAVAAVLVAWSVALEKNCDAMLAVAYADGLPWPPVASILSRRFVTVAVIAVAWVLDLDGSGPLVYGVAMAAGALVGEVVTRASSPIRQLGFGLAGRPRAHLARESWPFLLTAISAQARALEVPIATVVAGAQFAGFYTACARLINPALLMSTSLTPLMLPHSERSSVAEASRLARRGSLLVLASYLVLVPATFVAGPVLELIYGPEYLPAVPVFVVLLLGVPPVLLASPLGAVAQGQGAERPVAAINLWTSAAMLVLALALGSWIGGEGVAAAVAIAFTVRCVLLYRVLVALPEREPAAV